MEKFVHSYLSRHYYLSKQDGKDYFIFAKDNEEKSIYLGTKLIEELESVFSVDKDLVKKYVNSWAKTIRPRVSLKHYWNHWTSIGLPIAIRIAPRTIEMDLVRVQPMSGPSGQLNYFNYQYSGNTQQIPNRNGYVYDAVAINRAVDEYIDSEERNRDERIRLIVEAQSNIVVGVSSRGI